MHTVPKISPHAKSHKFTKNNISLYQDNSLSKAERLKSQFSCNGPLFKIKEKNLLEQITQRKKLKSRLIEKNKIKEIVEMNLKQYKLKQELENASAIMIQKHIRGYLVRKLFEDEITRIKKTCASKCVNIMQTTIYSMWIDLKYFRKEAKIIEKAYLHYRNRKKLLQVIDLYVKYMYDKKAEKYSVFMYLRMISCRNKLWELKRPGIVIKKLRTITENLSLIKLRRFWKEKNLSYNKLMVKLKKINRFQKPKSRKPSLHSLPKFCAHQLTYSLENIPIVYNENILLGSDKKPKSPKRQVQRKSPEFAQNNARINNARQNTRPKSISRNIDVKASQNFSPAPEEVVRTSKTPTIGNIKLKKDSRNNENQLTATKTNFNNSTKFPRIATALNDHSKIEKITYFSPVCESLGFKSFHFKVWKPLSEIFRSRAVVTPISKTYLSEKSPSNHRNNSLGRFPKSQRIMKRSQMNH